MKIEDQVWKVICDVRDKSPLVLNITNFVAMNNTANALLAVGASPIMAHSVGEVEDMVALCGSTVINIGTPDDSLVQSMKLAMARAALLGRPTVLDPVGAGATQYRNKMLQEMLRLTPPTYIRGNAGEIMTLAGVAVTSKGVDSTVDSDQSVAAAQKLSRSTNAVVSVSGKIDVITDGKQVARIDNGDQIMTLVTGMGCTSSALLGAFAAVEHNKFVAAVASASLLAVVGEMAACESVGPGSLQVNIIDILFSITEHQFKERVRISIA